MVTAGRLWMSTVVVGEPCVCNISGFLLPLNVIPRVVSKNVKKNEDKVGEVGATNFCAFSARRPLQCSSHKSRPLTVVSLLTHVQNTDRHSAYVAKSGIKHRPSELERGNERHRPSKQTADCEQSWR